MYRLSYRNHSRIDPKITGDVTIRIESEYPLFVVPGDLLDKKVVRCDLVRPVDLENGKSPTGGMRA